MPRIGKACNDYMFKEMIDSGLYHVNKNGVIWTKKKYGGPGAVYSDRYRIADVLATNRYQVRHNGVLSYSHRFVWFWYKGEIPEGYEIDHINNDTLDNRIENLQLLTRKENQRKAERDGLVAKSRHPSDNRKNGARRFWSFPGRKEQLSKSHKLSWEKRRLKNV